MNNMLSPLHTQVLVCFPTSTGSEAQAILRDHPGHPRPLAVPGISRPVEVKIASTPDEWRQAFQLVRHNYLASGYEAPSPKLVRFTPYHALPDTTVFVARHQGQVLATFTLVPDNTLLGLPLQTIYPEEIGQLRREGRRLAEVTSLAMRDLDQREFLQVFTAMIRLMKQYHVRQGGDTWVIAVNPKHRNYYCKGLGYAPLGPCRAYEAVEGAPAEAYVLDRHQMRRDAPKKYAELFGEPLPGDVLTAAEMPAEVIRELAEQSSQTAVEAVEDILAEVEHQGSPRRW